MKRFLILVLLLGMASCGESLLAASPDFRPERIEKVLSGRSQSRQRSMLQEMSGLKSLSADQSRVMVAALQTRLEQGKQATDIDLMLVWYLRLMSGVELDQTLTLCLSHPDPRVHLLTFDAMERHTPEFLLTKLVTLHQTDVFKQSFAYRKQLADAVAAYANALAVGYLIDLLLDASGILERNIVLHLRGLTGQSFANDAQAWKAWWLSAGSDYRGPPDKKSITTTAQELAQQWDGNLPEFFDVPLYGKKIVFVIDKSKSMESSVGNETRIEVAQRELLEAIRAMEEDVEFNIISFDESVETFYTTLVPANSSMKEDAARYIYSLFTGNKTATFDALAQSLSFDPNTEQLILLSDGKPTAGSVVDIDVIIARITQLNLFQRTSIDTLGIDTENESERLMKSLAEQNNGTYTKLR